MQELAGNQAPKTALKIETVADILATAEQLGNDLIHGLNAEQVAASRQLYGSNRFTELPRKSFLARFIESLRDKTLIILMIAAGISIALGILTGDYLEGIAILVAVAIASLVGTWNEHQKDKEFVALNKLKEDRPVKVIRAGELHQLSINDLVVGELVEIGTGDKIPADGFLVRGVDVRVDQAMMTGEPQDVAKEGHDLRKHQADALGAAAGLAARELMNGTTITAGHGVMLVTAIGDDSRLGKLRKELQTEDDPTPLQERLSNLADKIGLFGFWSAILTFAALIVLALFRGDLGWPLTVRMTQLLIEFGIIAVTIVVVAVPEGLPLAVTASLAYSMRKMQQDMNLVRRLMACETMGAATVICSDKTGTLTTNRMSVAAAWLDNQRYDAPPAKDQLRASTRAMFSRIAAINSTSNLEHKDGLMNYIGSPTECALLTLIQGWGENYLELREATEIEHQLSFTSDRKRMATLVQEGEQMLVLVKGAPEIVLARCTQLADGEQVRTLEPADREAVLQVTRNFAALTYRTLALAYRWASAAVPVEESEQELILLGIVGIADPVRPEVPTAIEQCRAAGIDVKMITGDNRTTAEAVARQIGMLKEGDAVIEGNDFQQLSDAEVLALAPRLRVLARVFPEQKKRLVELLRQQRHVVAVTGDGVNDGPALKEADVGLAMGKYGTEVAKEASDIVILDDNFASIVKSVSWGRTIFQNIRKFLQFQLTVNVVALATAFFGALLGFGTPLTAVQLLWVNLIMDTLAALALGLEPPSKDVLQRPPHGRRAPLITRTMWFNILAMGTLMFLVLMVILNTDWIVAAADPAKNTILFNVFVFLQIWNEFNCRSTRFDQSILTGVTKSKMFLLIVVVIIITQVLLIQFGGEVFSVIPLDLNQWLLSVALGAVVLPLGWVLRLIGRGLPAEWFVETAGFAEEAEIEARPATSVAS